ncbi:MAG TPA: DUF1579 family protein [Phycisphaerae bacterium]|nr:DUF1579 family protein [Phycisphaerae bacterium]HNU46195.1 DUF1579 family protein [Phycisphaerae bacterium]
MPGEEHKLLNQMAGPWKTKVRYRMSPDTPAVDSEGTATRRWVLGNRFLLEEFDGGNLGLPFQGLALYGYDTFEQKYTSVWVDTTSTAITRSLGSCQDHCTQILFTGEHGDAWSGTKKKTRGVVRLVSPTEHVLELHEPDATGSDFLVLSITYQRSETPPQVGPTRPPRP